MLMTLHLPFVRKCLDICLYLLWLTNVRMVLINLGGLHHCNSWCFGKSALKNEIKILKMKQIAFDNVGINVKT